MSVQNSDFLVVSRDGVNYKAAVSEFQQDLNLDLDFAPTDHTHDEYTMSVDVAPSAVTGAAGTTVKVENIGTTKDAVFKFTIPKGDKGEKGEKGNNGTNGTNGSQGATGYVKMKTGTSTNPSLSRGEMYWNYSNFVIYVGK